MSSPQLERKFIVTELPFAFLSSGALFWGILGFKSIFARWISAYFTATSAACVISLIASFKYNFFESYSAITELPRKELSSH